MNRQRGSAVIAAMLVAALAATAASFALERQHLAVSALEVGRDRDQARWALRGGAHWARTILQEDARSTAIDHDGELWASGLPTTDIENGTLAGRIADQQGLLNLANLRRDGAPSERDIAMLRRLLAAIGLRAELADAIAAQPPVAEIEELYQVRGCDEATLARLRQFATVLPRRTPVNVNTAPAEVLVALVDGLTLAEAMVLAHDRRNSPMRDSAEFRARLPRADLVFNSEDMSVQSRYFLVEGRAKVGRADARLRALLERQGVTLPSIVWQRIS